METFMIFVLGMCVMYIPAYYIGYNASYKKHKKDEDHWIDVLVHIAHLDRAGIQGDKWTYAKFLISDAISHKSSQYPIDSKFSESFDKAEKKYNQ